MVDMVRGGDEKIKLLLNCIAVMKNQFFIQSQEKLLAFSES